MSDEWEKKIGLADIYGTVAEVSFLPVHVSPTAGALRQLAAAMLDGADAMEAE
jgi:hypothetical protein